MTLPERIDAVLAGKPKTYYDLAHDEWPEGVRAWRYAHGGGPPG